MTLQPFHEPADIERRSFAIIDAEAPSPRPFTGHAWEIARRLVHTSADFSLLGDMHLPDAAIAAGIAALRGGASIYTDTEMARAGMPRRRLDPLGCRAECLLALPGVSDTARRLAVTRSRAALLAARDLLPGSILAVGNAPTTLIALAELLDRGAAPPALVIAMPVGFVNAAESKELILEKPIPCLALRGRRGGSPLAAATLNALAEIALRG